VSGFKEHFLDKYFAYRRRYVDYIAREAPDRAHLAVLSEIARLGFMIAGNVLCAAILWVLTAGAASRPGSAPWAALFGLLALMPTAFAALAVRGAAAAVADRGRVRDPGPANGLGR
jgi:hypothetical protein